MKNRIITSILIVFSLCTLSAQEYKESISKGSFLIEANTGLGGGGGLFGQSSNTSFGLISIDGTTIWALGGEAGYFVADKLALKGGLGFSKSVEKMFTYKLGAKYYLMDKFPLQLDFTGAKLSGEDVNPLWLGAQAGYALFLTKNIAIEPGVRYNYSLNKDFTDKGIFEARIGFVLFF